MLSNKSSRGSWFLECCRNGLEDHVLKQKHKCIPLWNYLLRILNFSYVSFFKFNICVPQLCPTLLNTMDCSTLGFPVLHYLLEFAQTHWVGDAIQPSQAPKGFLNSGNCGLEVGSLVSSEDVGLGCQRKDLGKTMGALSLCDPVFSSWVASLFHL